MDIQNNISVLGSGAFGISMALILAEQGKNVTLWSYKEEYCEIMRETRENPKVLKGIKIPESINITSDITHVSNCSIVIVVTPSYAVKETILKAKEYLCESAIIVLLAKGMICEDGEYMVFSQLAEKLLDDTNKSVVSLTGPTHAEEIALKKPSAILASSKNYEASIVVQKALMNDMFRVYVGDDVLGAQLGGAFKNVIAISAGVSQGMGFGDNAAAGLITRGFAEISRLGVAMGANKDTFTGLSGIGDLIVTCMSSHSRNRRLGEYVGQGMDVKEACDKVGSVVEGFYAAKYGYEISKKLDIEMPILCGVYEVLYNNKSTKDVFMEIMNREGKNELH